jgi:ubiquinone/menaquinone biosynthesis C-methylase UbiE
MARTPQQDAWLKFFNEFVYNALAPAYNALDWLTLGIWWRLISRALPYIQENEDVLEVAFGPGKLHAQLAKKAKLCVGVDLARGMCRFTQRRLRRAGLPSRIVQGSVSALPLPTSSFGVVVSTAAFSGFPDGMNALREMVRLTRPGGWVVIVDFGLPRDGNRVGTFWARLWEKLGDFIYDQPAMMRAAGLEVNTFEEFGPGKHMRLVVGSNTRDLLIYKDRT